VSKEEAAAFQARIVELEAELNQATTRAEAAEQECTSLAQEVAVLRRSLGLATQTRLNGGVEMRPVRLFRVQDSDRPLYVVAGDWAEALQAWRRVIAAENEGLSELENPQGIEFVASERELLLSARDIDQVVR
jgi:hypothetical protein